MARMSVKGAIRSGQARAYCYAPSCSRMESLHTGGLCLMHAVERGQAIACSKCGHMYETVERFPGIACSCA